MENRPKFSVVVPCYNSAHCMQASLDSIAKQVCQDWECIVVNNNRNNGKNDNDQEQQFNDQFGIFIKSIEEKERNGEIPQGTSKKFRVETMDKCGVGTARTQGVKKSKGEWIAFLDADDSLTADAFAKMEVELRGRNDVSMARWESIYKQENGDIVIGDDYDNVYKTAEEYLAEKSETRPTDEYENGEEYLKEYCRLAGEKQGAPVATWRYLFNGDEYREKFFQPDFVYEDSASVPVLIASAENKIICTDHVCHVYQQDGDSQTQIKGTVHDIKRVEGLLQGCDFVENEFFGEDAKIKLKDESLIATMGELITVNREKSNNKKNTLYGQLKTEKEKLKSDLDEASTMGDTEAFEKLLQMAKKEYSEHGYSPKVEAQYRANFSKVQMTGSTIQNDGKEIS